MATVNFKKGLLASLPSTYAEGTFYVTTDERGLYLDVSDSTRIRIGDFQEFATLAALKANVNPSTTALYYVADINCLCKFNGSDYVQINLDTGMTSVEVTGEGNALVNPVYDPSTRKLTFTAVTLATPDDLAAQKTELTNLINEKTADIASGTAMGELTQRVTDAEGEIDALQEQVGEGTVASQIDTKIDALKLSETYEPIGTGAAEAGKVQDALDEYKTANDTAVKAAQDAADAAQGDVDALAGKVGEVPADKTIVQMIADAQTAATYDDTQVKADIKANTDAIALLNDASTVEGSIDYKIAQAVAAIMENPDETMNSINELVTWVNDHAEDALELSNKVSANETAIGNLQTQVGEGTVEAQISAAIEAALKVEGADKYALAADLAAAIERIVALEAYKVTNDAAVAKVAEDLANEAETARAAEKANADAAKAADDKAVAAQNDVDALEAAVGEVAEGKTVVTMISDAQAAAEQTAAEALENALTWGEF